MTHKKPAMGNHRPDYPSIKAAKVDRRRFLALLGGGVASSALVSACYDSDELERIAEEDSESDTEGVNSTESVEIDTNEPLAGGDVAPEYYERRLPGEGFQTLHVLLDGTTVVYAISTRYEEWSFGEVPEQDLLFAVSEKLSKTYKGYEFGDEKKLPLIEKTVQEVLEAEFLKRKGLDPVFIDVSFIVERIEDNIDIAGDVAEAEWPTDNN